MFIFSLLGLQGTVTEGEIKNIEKQSSELILEVNQPLLPAVKSSWLNMNSQLHEALCLP